jgi:ATP-dependent Clp protease protease subunit
MDIIIKEPEERMLMFTAQVNQDTIAKLSKHILEINQKDDALEKDYKKKLNKKYKRKPIKIYIDSYGGAVYQCFGLLGIIENSKTPIHTIVTGCAMSCGFMIAITGHKRFAYKRATLLYHQVSDVIHGKLKEIKDEVVETTRLQEEIEAIVLEKTKISKTRLEKSFKDKEDWFIPAKEALKLNCIDEIIS